MLSISAPPILDNYTSPVYGIKPQSSSLTCTFYGNPEPEITWTKLDGGALYDNTTTETIDKCVGTVVFKTSTITFNPTDLEHYGTYECSATNIYDTVQQNVSLIVHCKSFIFSVYFKKFTPISLMI